MNFIINHSPFNWHALAKPPQQHAQQCYVKVKKELKKLSRQAWVKTFTKLNQSVQGSLVVAMRTLHMVEKTFVFKQLCCFCDSLFSVVKQDSLTLTGLITGLVYVAWCLFFTV